MPKSAHLKNDDELRHQASERHLYWDNFYSEKKTRAPAAPSQFAVFVREALPETGSIIEIGCGNGRDSEFFAGYGLRTLATDSSEEAIKLCRLSYKNSEAEYMRFAIGNDSAPLISFIKKNGNQVVLYARFLLHALTDKEELAFYVLASEILPGGSHIALEYRTLTDEKNEKVFGRHYRRFINHAKTCEELKKRNFKILHEIEGAGMAKYKEEDAIVGRCIAVRNP